ncbi:hypothetical protein ANN_14350 [Periplaneta americana]|uniref:Uncharacterized protein n=1 Tax=Periplaneta americana TaxID=6978 RepID=A0ABQ8SY71_PERAM|nr:hypothetical protein ANN_14350 [Periplaneta americana]
MVGLYKGSSYAVSQPPPHATFSPTPTLANQNAKPHCQAEVEVQSISKRVKLLPLYELKRSRKTLLSYETVLVSSRYRLLSLQNCLQLPLSARRLNLVELDIDGSYKKGGEYTQRREIEAFMPFEESERRVQAMLMQRWHGIQRDSKLRGNQFSCVAFQTINCPKTDLNLNSDTNMAQFMRQLGQEIMGQDDQFLSPSIAYISD